MKKPIITHNYPLIALIVVALAIFIFACFMILPQSKIDAVEGSQKSECQYPLRSTNPPDGCDNSDPCDPANAVKGGSGECTETQVSQEQPMSHNAETGEKPVESGHKCE